MIILISIINELKVFNICLDEKNKYLSFPIEDRKQVESLAKLDLVIKDIKIKSPDNPIQLIPAKLMIYQI